MLASSPDSLIICVATEKYGVARVAIYKYDVVRVAPV